VHFICVPGFFPGFLFFHGLFGFLLFALIVGLIVKHLFGDGGAGGYRGHPGAAGPGTFCGQCGAPFREATAFCPHCGARRG
jgi:uncharacterized membrane protein